ncbi:unnamed protein product [Diatraea saccharalis]|uniref:Uncharacterized protein n=1 Tax=Diatraea saccharalis TaxID=40085 RepID=A0A9N9RFR5_9NEOP|nr:unnamed protein product [Diatraea saccharalis]
MNKEHKNKWTCQECEIRNPKVGNTNTQDLQHDSNIVTADDNCDEAINVTLRSKNRSPSKRDTTTAEFSDRCGHLSVKDQASEVIKELRPSMFKGILKSKLATIKHDLQELTNTVSFLSGQYDDMNQPIVKLTTDNNTLKADNSKLKATIVDVTERLNNVIKKILTLHIYMLRTMITYD